MDWIDIGIYLSYIMIAVALLAAIVMPLIKSLDNPAGLLKSALGVVGLLVLFALCYFLSDSSVHAAFVDKAQKMGVSTSTYQLVGGSIVMIYVTLVVTVVAIVIGEFRSFFN
jgi:ABC-type phosphate transport system permease subunit